MGKLEPFDGKATKWQGLWYHKHNHCFTSIAFNLADIKKFKGIARIVVRKNRFFENGKNGRPNYVFMIVDAKNENFIELEVDDLENCEQNEMDEQVESGSWETLYDEFWPGTVIGYRCTECGTKSDEKHDYCPHCGAEMG